MRKLFVISAFVIAVVAWSDRAVAQSLPVPSQWVNELGSVMTLTAMSADGWVTGVYSTSVGCRAGTNQPLTGWFNGGAFTFTVNWLGCGSLTSWTGNLESSNTTIVTLWYLALSGPPKWNSIIAGTDTFQRTN